MNFKELAVIHDVLDDIVHVVRLVRIVRNYLVENIVHTVDRVIGRNDRGLLQIVLREV